MDVAIVGCGVEGSTLAGLLAREPAVSRLILVSRGGTRARALRQRLSAVAPAAADAAIVRAADALDAAQLNQALDGAQIVVNATLPDANVAVATACLDVGAHYLDMVAYGFEIPGTPRSHTLDALLDLDPEFRERGLTAIPNTGASPGLTDLAAAQLSHAMDQVDRATVMWADRSDAQDLLPPFTPEQIYTVCMPTPTAWENDQLIDLNLLDGEETVMWPDPIGTMTMLPACHMPETRTLQHAIPGVRRIDVKTGLAIGRFDSWTAIWVEGIRRAHENAPPEVAAPLQWLTAGFGKSADYHTAIENGRITKNGFGISVTVYGTTDDEPTQKTFTIWTSLDRARAELPWASAMSHLTAGSTPREVILTLATGQLPDTGVIPSVGALTDADQILERVLARPYGHQAT
jgi:saccharopine dehydrogenase-like NADP-dependent oxidoreductase